MLVESARRELLANVMNGADKKNLAAANVLVSDGENSLLPKFEPDRTDQS